MVGRRIMVFPRHDRAYIVGAGDYLVLKYVDGHPELRRVEDEEDTYVPTTMIGIGCLTEDRYLPTTVDGDTVGVFYLKTADGYVQVLLDGDENLPEAGVTYYRKVTNLQEGKVLDAPNMLSNYRINTLYGTDAPATYVLDCPHVDRDSDTVVELDVVENGTTCHYTLREQDNTTVTRSLVVGDDASGLTLTVGSATQLGVGSLRLAPTEWGMYELLADGGWMRWYSSGITSSDWNSAVLILHDSTGTRAVATAVRSSVLSLYTVTWTESPLTLAADFGKVGFLGNCFEQAAYTGTLPVLVSALTCDGTRWGSIDYRHATITFERPTTPEGLADNISVRFKCRDERYNALCIAGATVGAKYGVSGNADRLFVAGEDTYPTTDFHSQSDDWTYFAPSGRTELGREGRIVAYLPTQDGLLTLLDAKDSNAYWRRGTWVDTRYTVGEDTYEVQTAVFGVTRTATLPVAASAYGCAVVDGDTVYLARDGLYRLVPEALTDARRARPLSMPLDGVDWTDAAATVWGNRYLVSDGRNVYVGDSRYTLRLDTETGYEWTVWDLARVRCWYRDGHTLCCGTEDGRLLRMAEDWCDVTFEDVDAGRLSVDAAHNRLVFDQSLSLSEGDELYFGVSAYAVYCSALDWAERVYVDSDAILSVYEGDRVCPSDDVSLALTVGDVDWGTCSFVLTRADGSAYRPSTPPAALLVNLKGRRTLVKNVDEYGAVTAAADGHAWTLWSEHLPLDMTARIVHRAGVHAVYAAEAHALGTPDVAKQLLAVTVEADSSHRGAASVSVRNTMETRSADVAGLGVLDYTWVDMGRFTFEGAFPRAHTARLKIRFCYLAWRIDSDNAGDLALRGVCLRYRYLHPAKGVVD